MSSILSGLDGAGAESSSRFTLHMRYVLQYDAVRKNSIQLTLFPPAPSLTSVVRARYISSPKKGIVQRFCLVEGAKGIRTHWC